MKKQWMIILAISLCAVLIAGCGSLGQDGGTKLGQEGATVGQDGQAAQAQQEGQQPAGEDQPLSLPELDESPRQDAAVWVRVDGGNEQNGVAEELWYFSDDGTFQLVWDGKVVDKGTYEENDNKMTITYRSGVEGPAFELQGEQYVDPQSGFAIQKKQ